MKPWKLAVSVGAIALLACAVLTGCQTETYTPQAKEQTVSAAALGKEGVLRVGVNANSAPLAGIPEGSTKIIGIDADVAAYLADQMGLKLELFDVGADPEAALKAGTVDVVLGVDASATDVDYWRSERYIGKGVALFGSESESAIPVPGDTSSSIAAQEGTWSEKRVTDLFGTDVLVKVIDLRTALENVTQGTVRYAAGDVLAGTYLADYPDYDIDVKVLALLQDPSGYCAAVSQSNTELWTAIGGALKALTQGGMMDIIETKWLGAPLNIDGCTVVKTASLEAANERIEAEKEAAAAEEEAAAEGEGEEGEGEEAPAEDYGYEEAPAEDGGYEGEGTY